LAVTRGCADIRNHGVRNGRFQRWPAGHVLYGCAARVTAERNGLHVRADERLPFSAVAEADIRLATRAQVPIRSSHGERAAALIAVHHKALTLVAQFDITNAERKMTTHMTGTREEWLAARLDLLKAEKELARRSDELAQRRQELPWVRVDKAYRFETDEGSASLADLFRGSSQLLDYHFMFGPDYEAGCPSCSSIADSFIGIAIHLANHDVMLWGVSRAPLAKLGAFKQRMGWTFPWASSHGGDFNFDFNVSLTEQQQREGGFEYNYRPGKPLRGDGAPVPVCAAMTGTDGPTFIRDRPGMSAFVREDGAVYHTYSAYARGLDGLWGMYQWLDRAPKGRNEMGVWWRHHDKYDKS